jgi:outer membrane protein assembly factor BamB/predicted Ser/Thr protein kinase
VTNGQVVAGRYRLERRLGSGGMGVVWLSYDEVLRRRVAVKELFADGGSARLTAEKTAQRTLREARAAAALRHPNVVSVYDTFEDDNRLYIVMEYIQGRTLKQVVADDGPLAPEEARRIAEDLLSALSAAHESGIIHRDIKPANVLIGDDGVPRLADFGIASMNGENLSETGVPMGSAGYLAPEQARGERTGPPADLFGLGATLYFALEGIGPFDRGSFYANLGAMAKHEIRPPVRAGAFTPLLLELLLANPSKRPTLDEARALLAGRGARRRPIRRRAVVLGGAALVAGAAVGAWAFTADRRGGRAAASVSGLGRVLWDRRSDVGGLTPAGTLLIEAHDHLTGVNPHTGVALWRHDAPGAAGVSLATSTVIASLDGQIQGVDLHSGALRWKAPSAFGGIVAADLVLTMTDKNNTVTALDAATGRRRWAFTGAGPIASGVQVAAGLVCVDALDEADGDELVALRPADGSAVWRARSELINATREFWGYGDILYGNAQVVPAKRRTIQAYDARSGALTWTVDIPTPDLQNEGFPQVTEINGVLSTGGLVLASLHDQRLTLAQAAVYAYDARTGASQWRRPLLNAVLAVTPDGRIYAATADSKLQRLDPRTGNTLWTGSTPGPADTLLVIDGVLIVSVGDHSIAYELQAR